LKNITIVAIGIASVLTRDVVRTLLLHRDSAANAARINKLNNKLSEELFDNQKFEKETANTAVIEKKLADTI